MNDVNRKKQLWIFAAIVCIVGIAAWAIFFVRVNQAYPGAELIQAGLNEPLQYGPYAVTVNEAYIEDTITFYEENRLSAVDKMLPEAILICSVTIERSASDLSNQEKNDLKIAHIAVTSRAWSSIVDTELYTALNKEAMALDGLRQGEKQAYLLPFELWRDSFSNISWEHLSERFFMLQLSLYPNKCEILFQA